MSRRATDGREGWPPRTCPHRIRRTGRLAANPHSTRSRGCRVPNARARRYGRSRCRGGFLPRHPARPPTRGRAARRAGRTRGALGSKSVSSYSYQSDIRAFRTGRLAASPGTTTDWGAGTKKRPWGLRGASRSSQTACNTPPITASLAARTVHGERASHHPEKVRQAGWKLVGPAGSSSVVAS